MQKVVAVFMRAGSEKSGFVLHTNGLEGGCAVEGWGCKKGWGNGRTAVYDVEAHMMKRAGEKLVYLLGCE